jgi:mannose-6-phosphate isomerase-like protein (cupin superfamily)
MRIERWDPRRDGPFSERALQEKIEARGYLVTARTLPAGAAVAGQPDARERIDAVVSGLIKVTLDGESAILTGGDIGYVPAGFARRIEVLGTAPARCLEAIEIEAS